MFAQSLIPPTMTVSRTIRLFPVTVRVFNDFGIDACCGGELTIEAAARPQAKAASGNTSR